MPKNTVDEKPAGKAGKKRHDPLDKQIRGDELVQRDRKKKTQRRKEEEEYVGQDLTGKILTIAREQQEEALAEEEMETRRELGEEVDEREARATAAFAVSKAYNDEEDDGAEEDFDEDPEHYLDDADQISETDERMLAMFLSEQPEQRRSLADIIEAKYTERSGELARLESTLDPKVVESYRGIGKILKSYRSGKVPKLFKIVPSLRNWEDILSLTTPPKWSPQAMYQATRLFASNLNADMAQRFFNLVLLPCCRDDIAENHTLNYHHYMALKKSLYKASAFYKGIILPLCESRTCTLREAAIFGSVIKKVSIPPLHSAAALLRLAEMEYTGANTLFIGVLINKKYALPLRVVDALVQHFVRFTGAPPMPILWHQTLLLFVQRYKTNLQPEQKDMMKELLKVQQHPAYTGEIRRELFAQTRAQGGGAGASHAAGGLMSMTDMDM